MTGTKRADKRIRIAVMVSGGGTNLQALIDAEKSGVIKSGRIVLVISNNPDAFAITRAAAAGINTVTVVKKNVDQKRFEEEILKNLARAKIEMIILAGFMSIPSFCGKGMYGIHVHEAALAYGVKVSGATVHYVNEIPDGGRIILQKSVRIRQDDTPESLQQRIMKQAEWDILPRAAELVSKKLMNAAYQQKRSI